MDIFSFWDKGRANAPKAVQICFDRWEHLNPEHKLHVFDEEDLRRTVTDLPFDIGELPVQARSDILRIRLLRMYGGAWVDATLLPVLPLDRWSETYLGSAGVFLFAGRPSLWRLGNFFILAPNGSYLVDAWDDAVRGYWTNVRSKFDRNLPQIRPIDPRTAPMDLVTVGKGWRHVRFSWKWHYDTLYPVAPEGRKEPYYPYFWQHYLLMQLIQIDPKVSAIVDSMTYRYAELCHTVQNFKYQLGKDFPKSISSALLCSPVQKLDWRGEWTDEVFELPDPDRVLI